MKQTKKIGQMVPIDIPKEVIEKDALEISKYLLKKRKKLKTFDNIEIIKDFELHFTTLILKFLYQKYHVWHYQNKIYNRINDVCDDQDAYNINRALSALRRFRYFGITKNTDQYKRWLDNRIKFALLFFKTYFKNLNEGDNYESNEQKTGSTVKQKTTNTN